MNTVWAFIKSTRWFFISAILIFFIAIGLSQIGVSTADGKHPAYSIIAAYVMSHQYLWMIVRVVIVLLFFLFWPVMVDRWSKQYNWPRDYTNEVKKRRWRYVAWFIVIDLTFQLL